MVADRNRFLNLLDISEASISTPSGHDVVFPFFRLSNNFLNLYRVKSCE